MSNLPHVAARLFNRPLAVEAGRLDAVLAAIGPRLGLATAIAPPAREAREARSVQPEGEGKRIALVPVLNTLVHRNGRLNADSGTFESYHRLGARLESLAARSEVGGIVLDLDSPGGEVDGLFALAERIRAIAAEKPIYAVVNESAYSAAYAIAASASRIFIPSTGGAGSIGVIAVHVDQSGFDEEMGLRYSTIYAGARKADFSPHEALSGEARKRLQAEIDRVHEIFVEHVAAGRPGAKLARVRDASLWFGADAVGVGLADEVGGIEEAISAMSEKIQGAGGVSASANATPPSTASALPPAPPVPQPPTATVVDFDAAALRAEGVAAEAQRVSDIAELCAIAGVGERLAEFLAVRPAMTRQAVGAQLLAERAAASDAAAKPVDIRSGAVAAGSVPSGKAFWDAALTQAFGAKALQVPGREFYNQARR